MVGSEGKFSKYGLPTLPHPVQSGPSAGDRCEYPLGFQPVLSIVRYPLATVCDIDQLCRGHNMANQDEYQVPITFNYPLLQEFIGVSLPGQLGFQPWTHGVMEDLPAVEVQLMDITCLYAHSPFTPPQ